MRGREESVEMKKNRQQIFFLKETTKIKGRSRKTNSVNYEDNKMT